LISKEKLLKLELILKETKKLKHARKAHIYYLFRGEMNNALNNKWLV